MTRKRSDADLHFSPPVPVSLKRADDTGRFTGYAATWDVLDLNGERISAGAFRDSLAEHRKSGSMPKLLLDHSKVVGRIIFIEEDAKGLRVEGQLNLSTAAGADVYQHVKAGDLDAMSIGYRVIERDGDTLKQIQLFECSIVPLAANPAARITEVKSIDTKRALRTVLHQGGWTRSKAEKAADAAWLIKADGADEDEPPYCHYCGDDTGERGPLLKGLDADICTSCAKEAAVLAQKTTHALIERVDAAILELKSIKKGWR